MYARLRGSKSLFTLYQNTDFPSLADEIAEPHPDMNIKVAAFTVSEKSSNTKQRIESCPRTQHADSAGGETRTSNPLTPRLALTTEPLSLCNDGGRQIKA